MRRCRDVVVVGRALEVGDGRVTKPSRLAREAQPQRCQPNCSSTSALVRRKPLAAPRDLHHHTPVLSTTSSQSTVSRSSSGHGGFIHSMSKADKAGEYKELRSFNPYSLRNLPRLSLLDSGRAHDLSPLIFFQ